ncbi:Rpn family recombination-promoting nuclease/putative transposase [Hyalangium rubrum]|uniref:Rpn family recombination-promoting nuclease/putative transposase n=1 Tax=Hyalangium rubrum TaxID=3103134 RepID=A0ABU5H6Q0_9BACT|nr:Rpn family recombination-promoting nuclease/putative transposase [Hyalangium sp. s54d21]MDY7227770.1 Rpn family recombination-promoting nuclease/putative transposase [Hyalangium sp. s54d21]
MPGPHDLFVRFTFGNPERAAAELRAALPPHLVSQVNWESLRREPGSVVDPELRETQSDLLFSARLSSGRPLLFYILLEHQSSVDRWMALRMLRYVVRQLEHWRKEHPGSGFLPVIIPLVLYHGPDGAWSAPRRVEELFDLPGADEEPERWRALVPRFEYLVDDLTAERAEALMKRPGPPLVRLALLALVYGRTEKLAEALPDWAALFTQVQAMPNGAEELSVVFRYLLLVGNEAAQGAAVSMLKEVIGTQRTEELMMTWGEKLIEKGRQQGRAEDVLRILAARGVQIDEEARQHILACTDMATLDRWFDQALKATHLTDVLGHPTQ